MVIVRFTAVKARSNNIREIIFTVSAVKSVNTYERSAKETDAPKRIVLKNYPEGNVKIKKKSACADAVFIENLLFRRRTRIYNIPILCIISRER